MSYNPALDGIRALAIIIVVLFHCEVPGFSGGFAGLDIFFVLSGYLITSLLAAEFRTGGIDVGRFYARRALRLYPTLLLLLLTYLILAPLLWPTDDRWLVATLSGLYLLDYGIAFRDLPLTIGHTWSLGVEGKFYLLWPLLLPFVLRTSRPIAWLLAAFFAVIAWRFFVTHTWGWRQAYFSFDTRMSGILLGSIAALASLTMSRSVVLVACVGLVINIAMPIPPAFRVDEGTMPRILLAEMCAFVLVCRSASHADTRFLSSTAMTYIGKLSYGIYIWHFPAMLLLKGVNSWISAGVTLLFSFTMAALCLRFIDMPIKRWRMQTRRALTGVSAA